MQACLSTQRRDRFRDSTAHDTRCSVCGKIPKQTLADRNQLSQWIDQALLCLHGPLSYPQRPPGPLHHWPAKLA